MSEPEHNWSLETYGYEPKKNWAMMAGGILGIILNVIGFRMWRSKSYWPWFVPTAAGLIATGFGARSYVKKKSDVLAFNILGNVLIVAPVAGYLIFNYIVWGRILKTFATGRGKYSLIKADIAIKALILCDIISFTAQGGGVGLRSTVDRQNTGRIIFLGGVIMQNITYGLFVTLLLFSHRAFHLDAKFDHENFPFRLFYVMYLSSFGIMFRTAYRFMELIQGNDGKFVTHEKWLYMFDAIPLAIAVAVYGIFWPDSMIQKAASSPEYDSINMQSSDHLNTGYPAPV